MGTCGRPFRRAFFIKSSIFQRNRRLYIKNLFCLLVLLIFKKHFHFGSHTSDHIGNDAKLIVDELNNHSIITEYDDLPNKILMLNDDF